MKAKEKVAQRVESNSKKPHRAAGELTLSERKFEAENTSEMGFRRRNFSLRVLRTPWWRRQYVEPGLDTVIVETAILLGPEWNIVRDGVISQKSRRIERFDKGWNTYKPGGGGFCRLEE